LFFQIIFHPFSSTKYSHVSAVVGILTATKKAGNMPAFSN
jgi:hypothetical protein